MSILSDELIERIRGRAAEYDASNSFFFDDLVELREAGYLRMFAPVERGGLGYGLEQVAREQIRLAGAAPATALAINMHLVWTGVAKRLADRGDDSLAWVLDDAVAGELFAFGNSEAGNDLVLFDSLTKAETVEGGYAFTGTKIFTSLSPAWTRLGIFGRHGDELVHGFITRETPGWKALDDWDTLGMRATQSNTTVLDGVVVPTERIARILPVGPSADPFIFGIFASFLLLISSVYAGIADRALELGVEATHKRTSVKNDGRSYDQDPDMRWRVADAAIALDALRPQIESLAMDVDGLVNHGPDWFRLLTGTKHRATETARYIVDQAMRLSGGGAYRSASELARLQRDVLAGIYHPSDTESVHNAVANNLLGPVT
jgi:alkylation response protein AidB-like acyl-CoA dehydrogenase